MNTATARLYETDFYGWTHTQANTLKAGNFKGLDLENLIEEIESMGRSEQREMESRLETLLIHLLKWRFQPERKGTSWERTIKEQRQRLADHLLENPSLTSKVPEVQPKAYRYAIFGACSETGLDEATFPEQCPWTFEQVMSPDFWPKSA